MAIVKTIAITEDHIGRGAPATTQYCATALAIREAYPDLTDVQVCGQEITFKSRGRTYQFNADEYGVWDCPEGLNLLEFIQKLDKPDDYDGPPEPGTLILDFGRRTADVR